MKRYDYLTEIFSVVFTAIQTNSIFQLISLILTCIATSISIIYTLFNWYKKAKQDGKITHEELKEGVKIVVEGSETIKNQIDKKKEGK